jgi:hypothetical protein
MSGFANNAQQPDGIIRIYSGQTDGGFKSWSLVEVSRALPFYVN